MTRYDSIDKLYKLNLNVPEVLVNLPRPKDPLEYEKFRAQLTLFNRTIREKRIRTVISSNDELNITQYIPSTQLAGELEKHEYGKEGIILIKAPKSKVTASGVFVPSHTHFKVIFNGGPDYDSMPKKYVWGMFPSFPTEEQWYDPVADISDHVANRRNELDGFAIDFTYHEEPEGVLSNYLVLWGFRELKYTEV